MSLERINKIQTGLLNTRWLPANVTVPIQSNCAGATHPPMAEVHKNRSQRVVAVCAVVQNYLNVGRTAFAWQGYSRDR